MFLSVANATLSLSDKYIWCSVHNFNANLYYVCRGLIKNVPPEGWWF